MFHNPALTGLIRCRGNAVECREKELTGEDSDRWVRCVPDCSSTLNVILMACFDSVFTPGVLEENAENLDQQLSSIAIPDGSRFFIGARSPIFPRDVRMVQGDFMPQDPYMFFVAHGHIDTPWLILEGFRLAVTLGHLLHHEKDFSCFRARTIVYDGMRREWFSPLITLVIPHSLGLPVWFPPEIQKLYRYSDLAALKDLGVPEVEIDPRCIHIWRVNVVEMGPPTRIQAAVASRLGKSWAKSTRKG